jgi:L-Ala-D/L-Glu epimerase
MRDASQRYARLMAIRLDANGLWSPDHAIAHLRALTPAVLELCEEPASGIEDCARVASASDIPIALDETTAQPGALDRKVCAAVCLKISRCGGISGLLDSARRARVAGYDVYLASTYDAPLGIAAALHAAAVIAPDRPCGLATLPLFEGRAALVPKNWRLRVPDRPGLGVEPTG